MSIPFYINPATGELELTADPSPLRESLGNRFNLDQISTRAKTLSPTKSYAEKPTYNWEEGDWWDLDDQSVGNTKILEDFEITDEMRRRPNAEGGRIGLQKGNPKPIAGSIYPPAERVKRENILKKFLLKNPDFNNPSAIAKAINAEKPNLKMSRNFVLSAMERIDLDVDLKTRHAKLFPEVKALDKIIKKNLHLFKDSVKPEVRNVKLIELFAKATGKDLATAESQLISRLRKLGNLYAGNEDALRYEKDLYEKIKAPKNYLNSNFHKNFVEAVTRAGPVNNATMAKLLGLPNKTVQLIGNTSSMMGAFDFKVAGDHTDIKAMMRDFANYKKNFLGIEYIKDDLNQIKRPYDIKINNLRKDAERITDPAMRKGILKRATDLQTEFANKTGYKIGNFDIKNNRVVINPQAIKLTELKHPYNETLQKAMKNFATTGATPEKFSGIDKKLMNASVKERIEIFKKIQGTDAAKQSKYLKALQKLPKVGKIATAIMAGTAATSAMTTLANAETLEPSDQKQEANVIGDVVSAVTENPLKSAAAVVGGDVALNKAKLSLKTLRGVDRALGPWMTPLIGLYTAITGESPDPTSAANLLIPSFWNSIMKRYNWQDKSADPIKRRIINAAKRGLIPTNLMPVISRVSGIGTAAFAAKYVAEESQPNIFRDDKGDLRMKDDQITTLPSNMIKDYHWRFASDDFFEKEYGMTKDKYKSNLPEFLDLEKQKAKKPAPFDSYFMGGIASLIK